MDLMHRHILQFGIRWKWPDSNFGRFAAWARDRVGYRAGLDMVVRINADLPLTLVPFVATGSRFELSS
jgi:hypothetical protein